MTSFFLVLLACEPEATQGNSSLSTDSFSKSTDQSGIVTVDVEVGSKMKAFLITATANDYPALETIRDPDGNVIVRWQEWYSSSESLTDAFFPWSTTMALNWPVRSSDVALYEGTWEIDVGVVDGGGRYQSGQNVDITVQTKTDGNMGKGTVKATIVYASSADAAVVSATEQAVGIWEDIWGAYGLSLEIDYLDSSLAGNVPDPSTGSSEITAQSERGSNSDVTVLVGEQVSGVGGIYGISGGIPGTLIAAPTSAVAISWLTLSGADGAFSDEELRLFGETLAHEVGHYSGLFHPVEDGFQYWDAIDDTSHCTSMGACESDLGTNLMFPYPICDWTSCTPQDQLSDGQVGVSQRYTGAL